MRRPALIVLTLALAFVVAPVATAAQCPRVSGVAAIQTDPSTSTGVGAAFVFHAGSAEVVEFDSALSGSTATQHWFFDAGTVTLSEHAVNVPIPGTTLVTIDSSVDVIAGGSGALAYRGLFDLASSSGAFRVSGRLCIGS